MEESPKTLYLIDGSSYIYRAFYALGRLTNSRGMPTQAVYGFAQMLTKVLRDKAPTHICVVFDAPGPTFRHEMYSEYKATRQKMPEDLVVQVPYIKQLVRYHGIPQMELEGYEADDLIAQAARQAADAGYRVVIISGDKDLHQLVCDPLIQQWDPQKDRVFDEAAVQGKFGVTPSQMGDYLALVGDSSDNIPGVKGVGDKSARQLLQQFGSLDGLFERIEELSSAPLKRKLMDGKDTAYLSRQLVAFKEDSAVPKSTDDYTPTPPLTDDLIRLYEELSFKTLLDALRAASGTEMAEAAEDVTESPVEIELVESDEGLQPLAARLRRQESIVIEPVVTSRDPMRAEIQGIALCEGEGQISFVPLRKGNPMRELVSLLGSEGPPKIGDDLKTTSMILKRHGIALNPLSFDTMLADYLINPGGQSPSLERSAAEYLGVKLPVPASAAGAAASEKSDPSLPTSDAVRRACSRASVIGKLAPVLERNLKESCLDKLFRDIEMPLIDVLASMEIRGILMDARKLEALSAELQKSLDREAALIYDMAKEEFNIQSPKQLAVILFEKLGLRVVKKTKTGPSTDMSVLEELALEHPVPEHILTYRSLAKLKGTYADSLPKLIHPQTGRIHTSYNQTVAATGRLSSSDPNLQNIPIRTEEGRKIRAAFVAPPGHVLLSADYSQIELRILAHYSRDEHLLEAFTSGVDVHAHTAAEMFNISPMDVTPEMRRQAKMINFGIIYGMSAFGLAQRLHITPKMARTAIDRYFQRYSGVKTHIEVSIESARKLGYTETLLGRRRAIPELQSRNHTIRQLGERLAVNTPIQGTAADLIKKAMIDLHGALGESRLKTAMLLQVHDELVLETPLDEMEAVRELVREKMERVWPLAVPLKIDMGWGENWAEAHP